MKTAFAALIAIFAAGSLYAGSIDYLSNQSADYVRTFSRNASTDSDAVHYNPAAVSRMEDGVHLYLSNMYIQKNYSATLDYSATAALGTNKKYETTEPSRTVPNLYAIYKKDNLAAMFGCGLLAGGGTVKYNDGLPVMVLKGVSIPSGAPYYGPWVFQSGNLKGSSRFYFASAGASYAMGDVLSFSAQARYVKAVKTYEGKANYVLPAAGYAKKSIEVDAEKNAQGLGGVFGVDFKKGNFLLAARFETETILDFKTTVNDSKSFGGLFIDGQKTNQNLPAVVALGASYTFFDRLVVTSSLDTFFIGAADGEVDSQAKAYGYSDDYESVGWELSGSAEYAFVPGVFKFSVGYMYNNVGGNSDTFTDFDYSLDSNSVGVGARITPVKDIDVVLGLGRVMYIDSRGQKTSTGVTTTKYHKDAWLYAIAVEAKI